MSLSRIVLLVGAAIVLILIVTAISPNLFRSQEEGGDPPPHSMQAE